jgi:predicted DNA-binding ribbon-helix-helix protein
MVHPKGRHAMLPSSPALNPSPAKPPSARSTLISRNVTIAGHRTSIRLEPEMWSGLTEICRREGGSLHEICTAVSLRKEENTSLTAAIRVFVMTYYRSASTEDGHSRAGHGFGVAGLNPDGTRPANAAIPSSTSSAFSSQGYGGAMNRGFPMNLGYRGNNSR